MRHRVVTQSNFHLRFRRTNRFAHLHIDRNYIHLFMRKFRSLWQFPMNREEPEAPRREIQIFEFFFRSSRPSRYSEAARRSRERKAGQREYIQPGSGARLYLHFGTCLRFRFVAVSLWSILTTPDPSDRWLSSVDRPRVRASLDSFALSSFRGKTRALFAVFRRTSGAESERGAHTRSRPSI